MQDAEISVRAARRTDVPHLVDLRIRHLGETVRNEPRFRLLPDVRSRSEQAFPVWLGQESRVVLVAEASAAAEREPPALVGYAMGVLDVRPPVLKRQRVGEIVEVYVEEPRRGRGIGGQLLARITRILEGRGAETLQASVPVSNESARKRLQQAGYAPIHAIFRRDLEEV